MQSVYSGGYVAPAPLPGTAFTTTVPVAGAAAANAQAMQSLSEAIVQIAAALTQLTAVLGAMSAAAAQGQAGYAQLGQAQQLGYATGGALVAAPQTYQVNPAYQSWGTPASSAAAAPAASGFRAIAGRFASMAGTGAAQASAQPMASGAPQLETRSVDEIKSYISRAASTYGVDGRVINNIAKYESAHDAQRLAGRLPVGDGVVVNRWDSNARKGTPSMGMFQFIPETFDRFARQARAANPAAWSGLGELNIGDWRQQALTTSWAVANGYGSHWTTYQRALS